MRIRIPNNDSNTYLYCGIGIVHMTTWNRIGTVFSLKCWFRIRIRIKWIPYGSETLVSYSTHDRPWRSLKTLAGARRPGNAEEAAGGGGVERGPALVVPPVDVRAVLHQELHHLQVVVDASLEGRRTAWYGMVPNERKKNRITLTYNMQFHQVDFSKNITVLRIRDVYPGSEFFHPGSRVKKFRIPDPDPYQRILVFVTQKIVSKLSEIWSEMFILYQDPDLDFLPIPDPGSRVQKGTGSRSRIRDTDLSYKPFPRTHKCGWIPISSIADPSRLGSTFFPMMRIRIRILQLIKVT